MKRALLALLLIASPAFAQVNGWAEMANGWGEMQTVPGFTTIPPPASATLGCVGVFLGSPLNLQCAPASGIVYATTTKSLDVTDGRVQAGNLRAIPLPASGAVTVEPKLSLIGGITVVAGSALVDGDALSVGDGVGVVPIEFDAAPGDGTTGGAVPIVFDGTETATEIRDAVKAILDASGRDWITSNQGADGIGLVRATPGASGGAITEAVADAGFTVNDWTAPTAATTYTYSLQACYADGTCNAAGTASTTAAGVAALSAYNLNRLSWSAVAGAVSYKVRRDVGGATQGVIWSGTGLAVNDTGLAGDGSAKPTTNGTGVVTADSLSLTGDAAVGGQVLSAAGTAAAPGHSWSDQPNMGWRWAGSGLQYFSINNVDYVSLSNAGVHLRSSGLVGWSSGSIGAGVGNALGSCGTGCLRFGLSDSASPVAQTIQSQGSTGTNIAGAPLTIRPGAGTGNATGSALIFQTPTATSSGTTAQTQTERARLSELGFKLASGTRPTCDASTRGTIFYVAGGAGVADTCEVCLKDAADAYAWTSLF